MLLKHNIPGLMGSSTRHRRSVVSVHNVFSLSGVARNIAKAGKSGNKAPSHQGAASAVLEAPAASNPLKLSPRKSIQGMPVNQRETVELIMALTSLDSKPTPSLVGSPLVQWLAGPK